MNLGLSVFSAILLILIFPRFNFVWLAPLALTPILVVCARESNWKRRFLNGWASGFVFWFGVCYWIQFVLEVHGGMGRWGGWGSFVLFAALKGLHMALFAVLAGFIVSRFWAIPAIAALWTGLERTHGPFGFTWLQLGNAGIDMPAAMRLAPVTGVYGLSFVFAMFGCAVALLILRRPRRELAWLLILPLLYLLPGAPLAERGREIALIVQPNIDSEMNWTTKSYEDVKRSLTAFSASMPSRLILWPEIPAPFYLYDPGFREYASEIALRESAYFLFGAVGRTANGDPLNSAMMLNPAGAPVDQYSKIKLVPFGEFVPPLFSFVNRITKEAGDFAPGDRIVVFNAGSQKIGAFICYESAFPDLVRQFARAGANVFVNLSNDGYFGFSAAREQHLSLVRMRAAENRRWIIRATNDGITAAVDPAGRVTQRMPPFQLLAAEMQYNVVNETTPYTKYGDIFAWSCLAAGIGFAMLGVFVR